MTRTLHNFRLQLQAAFERFFGSAGSGEEGCGEPGPVMLEPASSLQPLLPPQPPTPFDSEWLRGLLPESLPPRREVTFAEQTILLLALMPHIDPRGLDLFFLRNRDLDRPHTEFGGWKGLSHSGFLPTGETAQFVVSGGDPNDHEAREIVARTLDKQHWFHTENILRCEGQGEGEPLLSGALIASEELLARVFGTEYRPEYSASFPAQRVTTSLDWDDLVLPCEVREELDDIAVWLAHQREIRSRWALAGIVREGYRCLFYGPSGTGKTLTATLLGQRTGMEVYRVDLSAVVSKYIGETEKNLARVFDKAAHHDWILLFDEADALFGQRTETTSSNDRHANQQVAYLLQRIEQFPGAVVLTTNLKDNIDEAFFRRFSAALYFPLPDERERRRLWQQMLPAEWLVGADEPEKLLNTAAGYSLSGGSIVNVVQSCAIRLYRGLVDEVPGAVSGGPSCRLTEPVLRQAIRRELEKMGKVALCVLFALGLPIGLYSQDWDPGVYPPVYYKETPFGFERLDSLPVVTVRDTIRITDLDAIMSEYTGDALAGGEGGLQLYYNFFLPTDSLRLMSDSFVVRQIGVDDDLMPLAAIVREPENLTGPSLGNTPGSLRREILLRVDGGERTLRFIHDRAVVSRAVSHLFTDMQADTTGIRGVDLYFPDYDFTHRRDMVQFVKSVRLVMDASRDFKFGNAMSLRVFFRADESPNGAPVHFLYGLAQEVASIVLLDRASSDEFYVRARRIDAAGWNEVGMWDKIRSHFLVARYDTSDRDVDSQQLADFSEAGLAEILVADYPENRWETFAAILLVLVAAMGVFAVVQRHYAPLARFISHHAESVLVVAIVVVLEVGVLLVTVFQNMCKEDEFTIIEQHPVVIFLLPLVVVLATPLLHHVLKNQNKP